MALCRAPNCQELCVNNIHCSQHAKQFFNLYSYYKHLHGQLAVIDLTSFDKVYLLNLYKSYARVHKLRQQYRQKAFRPEFWDDGHDHMIYSLWQKLASIEARLEQLCSLPKVENTIVVINQDDELELPTEEEIDNLTINTLQKCHQQLEDNEIFNQHLPCILKAKQNKMDNYKKIIKAISNRLDKILITTFDYDELVIENWQAEAKADGRGTVFNYALVSGICFIATVFNVIYHSYVGNMVNYCYNMPNLRGHSNCCLKMLLKLLLLNNDITIYLTSVFMAYMHNFSNIMKYGAEWTIGFNFPMMIDVEVNTYQDYCAKNVLFSKLGYKQYFACRANFNQKSGFSQRKAIYFGFEDANKINNCIKNINLDLLIHQHDINDYCQACTNELKQKLKYGTLH